MQDFENMINADRGTGQPRSAHAPLLERRLRPATGWSGKGPQLISAGVLLALAYAALALLTQRYLSLPPAYASPIWAAAGLAPVALLVGGLRLWPGVIAGYLLFRLATYWDGSFGTLGEAVALGLAFAAGPTLQAVLAAVLARPGLVAMLRGQDHAAWRVLLMAGPLSCVVAPTLGVGLLVALGRIDASNVLSNWLIWWVGDSVGVLLAGPIFMLAVPAVRALWRGRASLVTLPLLATAILLVTSMAWFHEQERIDAREPIRLQAALAHKVLSSQMHDTVEAVGLVAAHFAEEPGFTDAKFQRHAASLNRPGLLELSWLPQAQSGRVSEAPMRHTFLRPDGAGARASAPQSPIDVAAYPEAGAALQRAAKSGQTVSAGPIRLDPLRASVMVLAVPVAPVNADATSDRSGSRSVTRVGTVLAFIDLAAMGQSLVSAGAPSRLGFELIDASAAGAPLSWVRVPASALSGSGMLWEQSLTLPDRTLQLRFSSAGDSWLPGQSTRSRLFLFSALLAAFQITLYVVSVAGRERAISRTVEHRTAQIAEGQRKLEMAMDISKMVDWELDLESGIFTLDDRYYRFMRTDATREGGYRMPYADWVSGFVHNEDALLLQQEIVRAREPGYVAPKDGLEFRVICRDGTPLYTLVRYTLERDRARRVTRVLGTSQDISERKAIELALRQSEANNRSIVDSSQDCMATLDLDGRLLDMNAFGCAHMGIDDLETVRNTDWFLRWQSDPAPVRAALQAASEGQSQRMQLQTPAANGKQGWCDLILTPVRGVDGEVARLLLVARDITAERETTQALARLNATLESEVLRRTQALAASEHRLRATFDVAAVGIAHFDPQGRLLRANPRFCAISHYTEAELKALPVCQLLHLDDRARNKVLVAELADGQRESFVQEQRYLRSDGSSVWVQVSGSAVRDDAGALLYRVVIAEDIEATRRARELALASEQRYRDLFESNPVPMWTYDKETLAFTNVNTAATAQYGYTREEFLGMNLFDIRERGDHAALREHLEVHKEGFLPAREVWHRRKDGTRMMVEVTSHDVIIDERACRMVLAHDITERKRVEAFVAGQNQALARIVAGAELDETLVTLCGLLEADSPDMRGSAMLLDADGRHLLHGAGPRLPPAYVQAIDGVEIGPQVGSCGTAAHRGETVVVTDIASDPLWQDFHQYALPHGLRACCSMPILDAQGRVLGTLSAYFTQPRAPLPIELTRLQALTHTAAIAITTERERSALEESEARFRAIYETAPVGIMLVARDGSILTSNARQRLINGYNEADLATRNVHEFVHADTPPEVIAQHKDAFERVWRGEQETYALFKRATRPDGVDYWVEIVGCVVRDRKGEGKYSIRIVKDVTDRVLADEQMRLRDAQFRQTFELAALGIGHVDASGRFQRVNPRLCQMTGYSEDELLQCGPVDLTYADDNGEGLSQRDRIWSGEIDSYSQEKRYVHKDGSLLWTNATVSAVRDKDGAISYTLGILEDISRRKNAEAELLHQQEINRLLLENLAEGVVACDDKGQLIMFNKTAREWHGADPLAIDTSEWANHYDLYDVDGRTPLPLDQIPLLRAFRGELVRNAEMSIVRNGAPARVVLASGAPLLDSQGKHRGAVVVMHDITERQRTLDQLRWMNELGEAIGDLAEPADIISTTTRMLGRYLGVSRCGYAEARSGSGDMRVVCDFVDGVVSLVGGVPLAMCGAQTGSQLKHDGRLVIHDVEQQLPGVAGDAFREHGVRAVLSISVGDEGHQRAVLTLHQTTPRVWAREEISLARTVVERCWATVERERARRELRQAADGLKAAHEEVEFERASLAQRVQERTAELLKANQELESAKDAAEQASRAKSAFLATVSHEIRTPMNGVLGTMELLEHSGLDGERGALLRTAQGSARSLLGLLNDLLDMAKIEAGRIEIVPAPSNVKALVEQVLSIHHPAALSRGITMVSRIDEGTPPWLLFDSLRVRQILGNLVSNAVKFTRHGGVELDLRSSDQGAGWHRVWFTVRDSGTGISPAVLQTLFQPFEQGGAELARMSGGTGLGLAICRGLSERMGGQVTLESEPGRGTVARLELVLREAGAVFDESQMDSEDSARVISRFLGENAMASHSNTLRILVVDDHPINRQLLMRQLAHLGLKAEEACDGLEALEKLRRGDIGLVITDCEMPHMDGYLLVQEIRRSSAHWQNLPVIAYTAHAMPEVAKRCQSSGMDEVLTKPLPIAELARALRKWWPQLMASHRNTDTNPRTDAVVAGNGPVVASVLDEEQFEQMTGGDREIERILIDDFRSDGAETLNHLAEAAQRGDVAACRRLAHRSKGACMVMGAQELAQLFAELDTATRVDPSAASWSGIRHRITEAFARLDAALAQRSTETPLGTGLDHPG